MNAPLETAETAPRAQTRTPAEPPSRFDWFRARRKHGWRLHLRPGAAEVR